MEFVVCNDFDDCNGDNLQNSCIIIIFDDSELCSPHDWEYTDEEGLRCFTELHIFPATST